MDGLAPQQFTVGGDLGRESTTYWLRPAGRPDAVVSMHKDGPFRDVALPYVVRQIAEPGRVLGHVRSGTAWDAEQREIGTVGLAKSSRQPELAPITQHGLGALLPRREGLSAAAHRVARFVDFLDIRNLPTSEDMDAAVPPRVRCAGPTSPGFVLTRHAGVSPRYEVTVHDPRVSHLLILAYLDRFNAAVEGIRGSTVH